MHVFEQPSFIILSSLAKLLHADSIYDTVWLCCNKTDSDVLEKLQRHAARVEMKSADSDKATSNLTWQTLSNRHADHTH